MSSRPKIPVDCGAWVGIPDIATGGDPPTPPSPLSKAPIFAFFRSLEWQRSPFPRIFVVRGGVGGRGGVLGGMKKWHVEVLGEKWHGDNNRECPPTPRMRSTGIFDRLLVVLMSLNTFYLDSIKITE